MQGGVLMGLEKPASIVAMLRIFFLPITAKGGVVCNMRNQVISALLQQLSMLGPTPGHIIRRRMYMLNPCNRIF